MSDKALALAEAHAEGIAATFRRIDKMVADTIEGLYEPPTLPDGSENPKYNPDALRNWADCSMRTRAALHLRKQAVERDPGTTKVIGVVILQGRASSAVEWETRAREVDSAERKAIDVVAK